MRPRYHMEHQTEYEHSGVFAATPEQLIVALPLVLKNLGWSNFDVCGLGLTAQMNAGFPADCLTAVVT